MQIISKESTGSTNDDVAELGKKGFPHLTTVVANFQSNGRGRSGKKWVASRGNNLLFSTLIRSTAEPHLWSRIPQIAGMKLIQVLESEFYKDEGLKMKWPNDLYYYDKKWSGILVESIAGNEPFAVLGVGINCFGGGGDYPVEIQESVTTLEEIFRSKSFRPTDILKSFLDQLASNLDGQMEEFGPVVDFANQRDYLFGRKVTLLEEGQGSAGTASGIGPEGELRLMGADGDVRRVVSGTVVDIE